MIDSDAPNYQGKRALMLLRVSTPAQEDQYSWPYQEKSVRENLIIPYGLKLDEARHIIRDTYTGLEFRERPVLKQILAMADRGEFDVLTMDVLDRLGRRGLEREIYRMQLREKGVRILTTDPNDHADDDSLIGELIRLIKGYQAEEELNNTRRRSMHGKRVKAEGDRVTPPKVIGNGLRLFGYTYVLDEKGKRVSLTPYYDVIHVDAEGNEWSEVTVVRFIFESAAKGITLWVIAKTLNEIGIPTPYASKGLSYKYPCTNPVWQSSAISRIIWNSGYFGEARFFKKVVTKRVPGKKHAPRRKTAPDEQVIVPIPALVTKEMAEAAQRNATRNRNLASRNNHSPHEYLLRAGLARCGHCRGIMYGVRQHYTKRTGEIKYYHLYACVKHASLLEQCDGCTILTTTLDDAAWEAALEIIQNPSLVNDRVKAQRSDDPTKDRRKQTEKTLANIRKAQKNLEDNATTLAQQDVLHPKLAASFHKQAEELASQEKECVELLTKEMDDYTMWLQVEAKLDELHMLCAEMRENLDNPLYNLTYEKKRELLEFFGITVIAFRTGHTPRYEIQCTPPVIVSLLSKVGRLSQQVLR